MPKTSSEILTERGLKSRFDSLGMSTNRSQKSPVNKLKKVEAASEPTLQEGESLLWWDTATSRMYLITKRTTNYKVQLS